MSKHIEVYPIERARERSLSHANEKFREAIEYINEKIEDAINKGMFAISINCGPDNIVHSVDLFANLPVASINRLVEYLENQGYRAWKNPVGYLYISWELPEASAEPKPEVTESKPWYKGIWGYQPRSSESKSSPPSKP